ncbi:ComF family protein [Nocardia barduliensis]|uniref:ComF family protein n=1 Tax=Nocardia barduliensis TaxID=2736643 RepID=UPI001C2D9980|nr:amidophosphoribosyltransferase [Nocardia barduliensis]
MIVGANIESIASLSDTLVSELVAPPPAEVGVCPRCRTWTNVYDGAECENCDEIAEALGVSAVSLSVVSLYSKPSLLRDWLTRYKGRVDDSEPFIESYVPIVRALLGRFFIEHGQAMWALSNGLDGVVVVPSTDRAGPHPLEEILRSLELSLPMLPILRRGSGDLRFRHPSPEGYSVTGQSREERRLLLVDDVYTTGARINSAAYALSQAGYVVCSAVVIARRINPDYCPPALEFWNRQRASPFDWATSPVVVGATT